MKNKPWTGAELNRLKKLYKTHNYRECAEILGRSLTSVKSALGNHKINCGRTGQFPKGNIPWNAGMKGLQIGGKKTQFKKGHVPATALYDGAVRKQSGGYLYVRIEKNRWKLFHREVWRLNAGEIPKGMIIVFKDGNRENCRFENLEMITRTEHARRNINYKKTSKSLSKIWKKERMRLEYGLPPASGFGEILRKKEKTLKTSK